jgi:hypothetical protein
VGGLRSLSSSSILLILSPKFISSSIFSEQQNREVQFLHLPAIHNF